MPGKRGGKPAAFDSGRQRAIEKHRLKSREEQLSAKALQLAHPFAPQHRPSGARVVTGSTEALRPVIVGQPAAAKMLDCRSPRIQVHRTADPDLESVSLEMSGAKLVAVPLGFKHAQLRNLPQAHPRIRSRRTAQ